MLKNVFKKVTIKNIAQKILPEKESPVATPIFQTQQPIEYVLDNGQFGCNNNQPSVHIDISN